MRRDYRTAERAGLSLVDEHHDDAESPARIACVATSEVQAKRIAAELNAAYRAGVNDTLERISDETKT